MCDIKFVFFLMNIVFVHIPSLMTSKWVKNFVHDSTIVFKWDSFLKKPD